MDGFETIAIPFFNNTNFDAYKSGKYRILIQTQNQVSETTLDVSRSRPHLQGVVFISFLQQFILGGGDNNVLPTMLYQGMLV